MRAERDGSRGAALAGAVRARQWLRDMPWETVGVPMAVVAISTFFSLMSPHFLRLENMANIGRQTAAMALVAWGQTMVILSGGIDLSPGAVVAFVSVVAATIIKAQGWVPGVLAGIGVGVAFGLTSGLLIALLRLPPFIVTLGMMSVARGAALTYTGGVPVFGLESKWFSWLGSGTLGGVPVMVVFALAGFLATYFILTRTRLGVYTYAIGGNETAARWAGIPVERNKVYIYTYAGLLTGLAGVLLAARVNSGQPLLGSNLELQSIASVCIGGTSLFGGRGSLVGTLFGVLLIGVLNNGLNILGVSSFVQQMIIGFTILIAVLVSVWRQR
ncbi:MAG: ABC transporter permease [Acetobacteraceae bacterium]|nr:ABC transporter permease [Acetobacteraceae bacterium]